MHRLYVYFFGLFISQLNNEFPQIRGVESSILAESLCTTRCIDHMFKTEQLFSSVVHYRLWYGERVISLRYRGYVKVSSSAHIALDTLE